MARARRPVDLEALVDQAEALTRMHGAVPRAAMKAFRPHLAELGPGLEARGLEIGSTVRLPLADQVLRLAETGFLQVKGLERKLAGATAAEVKAVVDRLVAKRMLVRVVRESGTGFVKPSIPVIEHEEVQELLRAVARLQKLLKGARPARGARPAILRADIDALSTAWRSTSSSSDAERFVDTRADDATRKKVEPRASDALALEIARRVRAVSVPTRVPELLRGMGLTPEAGKRALLEGASRGLFDLEPESGMGRLSREDAELCPPGPMGTRLSWVRARTQEGARS